MASFQDIADTIKGKVKSAKHFKIGKSGQNANDRFEQEHKETYNYIEVLAQHPQSKVIDELEIYLINIFKNYPNNDNKQLGGGEMTKSERYIIYLVWS